MNQKTLLAAGLALACSLSAPVFAADVIIFDPDGGDATNGDTEIVTLDWTVDSSLAKNTIDNTDPDAPVPTTDEFEVYSHASLAGLVGESGGLPDPDGLGTNFEITFIAGFMETITNVSTTPIDCSAGTTCTFSQTIRLAEGSTADPALNFFEIYYDDLSGGSLAADPLAGTGYNDGQLILAADLVSLTGNFTAIFTFNNTDGDGTLEDGELITGELDQVGDEDWEFQQTISGIGTTDLTANVIFQHTDFFKTDLSTMITDLFFNTSNVLPFRQTNPSRSFDDGSGGTISPDVGPDDVNGNPIGVNGFSGPDILFQTDANNSFVTTTEVPEPNTVLLFALGLLFLAYSSRRHYFRRS